MLKAKDILGKRAKMIHDARAILDKSDAETRDATAEERQQFDEIMVAADSLQDDAARATKLEVAETGLEQPQGRTSTIPNSQESREADGTRRIELRKSVAGDVRHVIVPTGESIKQIYEDFRMYLRTGRAPEGVELQRDGRALSKGVDAEGGFLSPPIEFMAELIKAIDDIVFMRQISRVLPPLLDAGTLGVPQIDTDMTDPTWTSEVLIGSEDSTFALGRRDLKPEALAKFIKVSKKLLRNSTMDVDALVRERLAIVFGRAQENGFLKGSGSGEPLGVFTASANGIPTSRDESEDNTTTAFTSDGLINAQMKVKSQYRTNASWIFHRDGVKRIRKLKDSNGQYIWVPSLLPNVPDILLGDVIRESEFAPNTFTTGLYVGIYGDFSQYWIVDALTMTVQVLIELFAATNQNGYLGRLETDGAPVDPEAFARVTLA